MHRRITVAILVAFVLLSVTPAFAQFRARSVNPEAVEFETAILLQPGVTAYRVEFFVAGSDTRRDFPVKALDVRQSLLKEGAKIRVPLKDTLFDMPNGQYVATIRTVGSGPSLQSEPTEMFVLAQEGTPQDRAAAQKSERFWTKVGIAIGASLFVVPLIVQ